MTDKQLTATPRKSIRELLTGKEFSEQIKTALPEHLKPERFVRIALTAMTRTPKLMECTPESFFKCLLDLSAMGLEPDGRRAHLIPYGNQCTLILDYKGIVELAMRSGQVSNIHADIVCENDVFTYDIGEIKEHAIDFRKERGAVYAVYAVCTFKDGTKATAVMSRDEVEAVRKRSRAGTSGPWVTDWNEMAKKTAFRRLSKWLPLSAEIREHVESDDDDERFRNATLVDVEESRQNASALLRAKTDAPEAQPQEQGKTLDQIMDEARTE